MSQKFDKFMSALESLCKEHQVQISVSRYDRLQVWDLRAGEGGIYAPDVEDRTIVSGQNSTG